MCLAKSAYFVIPPLGALLSTLRALVISRAFSEKYNKSYPSVFQPLEILHIAAGISLIVITR